jgi:hypothetical protein
MSNIRVPRLQTRARAHVPRTETHIFFLYEFIDVQSLVLMQWRTKGVLGGFKHPLPPKLRSFARAEPNSLFRGIYIRNNLIRIWVSLI